jgi:hypothetical protein
VFPNCSQIPGGVPTFVEEPASTSRLPQRQRNLAGSGELIRVSTFLPQISKGLQATTQSVAPTVQNKHHYTRRRQISNLARIPEEAIQDIGFMARLLTLCSLPRTDLGDQLQYKRQNGPYKLVLVAGGDNRLPFGSLPRLLLSWICTEAIRTKERRVLLGSSLSDFMRKVGMNSNSGGIRGDRERMKEQIDRLFNCHIDLIYEGRDVKISTGGRVASKAALWWEYTATKQGDLRHSWVELGEGLFNEIVACPVPIDLRILKAMRRSSLGLDLYTWLSYKTFSLYSQGKQPERLSWTRLYAQFGAAPEQSGDKYVVRNFRRDFLRELIKLKLSWPTLAYSAPKGFLEVRPSLPSIAPKTNGN